MAIPGYRPAGGGLDHVAGRLRWENGERETAELSKLTILEREQFYALRESRHRNAVIEDHNHRVDERIAEVNRKYHGWDQASTIFDLSARGLLKRR